MRSLGVWVYLQLGSWLYRSIRLCLKYAIRCIQIVLSRPRDFEPVVKVGEYLIGGVIRTGIHHLTPPIIVKKSVLIGNVMFGHPIVFAAFQGDYNQLELWLRLGLGGGCFKTITTDSRRGNVRPRYQEVVYKGQSSLINALGLPGPGIDQFLEEIKQKDLFRYGRPLGISIGGHCLADYLMVYDRIIEFVDVAGLEGCVYCELNISCPNTPSGTDLSQNLDQLNELLLKMRARSSVLIGVKVSPDQADHDLLALAKVVTSVSNMYLNLGNTQFKTCHDVGLNNEDMSIGGGGLSGPVLYQRTLEMVRLIRPLGIPMMATGGISNLNRVQEVLSEGAMLVGVATALVQDPFTVAKWVRKL